MQDNYKFSGHAVVLCGGTSSERKISLITGKTVYDGLKNAGIACSLLDTAENFIPRLQALKPDVAFIALHGKHGEDGAIQGMLEIMGIPYTGSNVQSSALSMDKYRTKLVWKASGLPTPDFCLVGKTIPDNYPFPCFVKATCQGSTIGTYPVTEKAALEPAIQKARKFRQEVMIEKWITGPEFSVSILHDRALPAVRIEPASGFYDYTAKYETETTKYLIPCGLSEQDEQKLQTLALQAFNALGCSGWGRVDFMQDKESGKFWLIEANTVPGMTKHSIVPQTAKAAGIDLSELLIRILHTADKAALERMKDSDGVASPAYTVS